MVVMMIQIHSHSGNVGVSVSQSACMCILCGTTVPQNQLEKHQCNASAMSGGGLLTSGSGGVVTTTNGNNGGSRTATLRPPSPPSAPLSHGIIAPPLTSQPTPASPSGSSATEGPPISFHGRDVSAHLLQSVGIET